MAVKQTTNTKVNTAKPSPKLNTQLQTPKILSPDKTLSSSSSVQAKSSVNASSGSVKTYTRRVQPTSVYAVKSNTPKAENKTYKTVSKTNAAGKVVPQLQSIPKSQPKQAAGAISNKRLAAASGLKTSSARPKYSKDNDSKYVTGSNPKTNHLSL